MRLNKLLAALSAAVLLLTACAAPSPANNAEGSPAEKLTITAIEDVPPFEEFSTLPISEVNRIKMELENIPIDSCASHYTELIETFLQDEELFDFLHITIERDDLSLVQGKNHKSLFNLVFHIDLEMDTTKEIDNSTIARDTAYQLMEHLLSDTFYALKVKRCVVSTYDLNGYRIRTSERRGTISNEEIFREQPETEYAAQSVAYRFSEENPAFELDKFGALPDTKELYVEYYVEDSYFGLGEEENQQNTERLETISETIQEYLLREAPTGRYIEENGLKILTISFRNGIFDNDYLTFNIEL